MNHVLGTTERNVLSNTDVCLWACGIPAQVSALTVGDQSFANMSSNMSMQLYRTYIYDRLISCELLL